MKRVIAIVSAVIIMAGSIFAADVSEKEVRIQTSAKCKMCKSRLERTLGLSKGVTGSSLNLDDKVMTVVYNPRKTDEAAIREVITKTGYDADNQEAVKSAHDKLPKCCRKTADAHDHK